mgnify:CR=1 FL=1
MLDKRAVLVANSFVHQDYLSRHVGRLDKVVNNSNYLDKNQIKFTDSKKIKQIKLVSTGEKLKFNHLADGLEVFFPDQKPEASYANVLEIT